MSSEKEPRVGTPERKAWQAARNVYFAKKADIAHIPSGSPNWVGSYTIPVGPDLPTPHDMADCRAAMGVSHDPRTGKLSMAVPRRTDGDPLPIIEKPD